MADNARDFHMVGPLDGAAGLPASDRIALSVVPDLAFAQVFAKAGEQPEVCRRLGIGGEPGRATVLPDFTALPLSPDQWMLTAVGAGQNDSFVADIATRVERVGYVSQQSDARVCVRLGGPEARAVMAKGCRLDLHPRVAGAGFCAQTVMARVGVILHQADDAPTFDILVYSGFARAFWEWMWGAAAEFTV